MSRTQEILQLHRSRRAAVQAFDFERAQLLSEQLSFLCKPRDFSVPPPSTPSPPNPEFTAAIESVQSRYSKILASLKQRHESQIAKLGRQHAVALEREPDRRFPPVAYLDRYAQLQAEEENFDEARFARRQAMAMRDHIIDDRKDQLIIDYERARANLVERQEAELKVFEQRLLDAIAEATALHRQRVEVFENRKKVIELKPREARSSPALNAAQRSRKGTLGLAGLNR
jgi:hypothetical protein